MARWTCERALRELGPSGYVKPLCWLCNKKLERVRGVLIFAEFTLPNGAIVKMHKVCAKDFKENPCSYGS